MYAAIYREPKENLQTDRPTHILVSTEGEGLGNLPYEAALTQALYIKKQNPTDQIIIISEFDLKNRQVNQLQTWNLDIVFYPRSTDPIMSQLTSPSLIGYMKNFSRIRSFHMFGHSNVAYGARLYNSYRFGWLPAEYAYFETIKNNFTPDAYAIMHGCNSGWNIAVKLSKAWNIPVAGSFTGTLFEKMATDGIFHRTDAKVNLANSNMGEGCYEGACTRQMPQNRIYRGLYGSYLSASLNYFKFFCNKMNDEKKCFTGMAQAMLSSVNDYSKKGKAISLEDYKLMVSDFLCPRYELGNRAACIQAFRNFNKNSPRNLFFMDTNRGQLDANFEGHNAAVDCKTVQGFEELQCTIDTPVDPAKKLVDTTVREYEAYIKGFSYLKEAGSATNLR